MDLTIGLSDDPFSYFTGLVGTSSSIGGRFAQLGDRKYEIDFASDRFRFVSIPALRPQQDTSTRPGEQTLSAEGLWRRVQSTWTQGAGQRWYDRDDGNPRRFYRSRGVNPWTEWELSLLHDVDEVEDDENGWTSLAVGVFGSTKRLVAAGTSRVMSCDVDGDNVVEVTGVSGRSVVASDGVTVYVGDTNGISTIDSDANSMTSFNTNITSPDLLFFGKNRLFALEGAHLWNVAASGSGDTEEDLAEDLEYLDSWTWTGATSGQEALFFSGYAGDKGRIFAVTIADDATGLNPPVVALELPDGEIPWCVSAYVGFVIIGTSLGVRIAQQDGPRLTMGPLVGSDPDDPTGHDVRCLEPQDRFVWYGYDSAFDDASGLGRIDLASFVEPLAPAFATDLMAPETGEVNAVITFGNRRWFTAGEGLYREADDYVTEGWVESGRITFNVADEKTPVWADLRHSALGTGQSVELEVGAEVAGYELVGTSASIGTTKPISAFSVNHARAVFYETRTTLNGTGTKAPNLTGVSLGAQVAPDRSFTIYLPLIIHEQWQVDGRDYGMSVQAEIEYLTSLVATQQLVRFRQGRWTALVFAEDYEWIPYHSTTSGEDLDGTMVLKLKSAEIAR